MAKTIDTSQTDPKDHLIALLKYCRYYINNTIADLEYKETINKEDVNNATAIIREYADDMDAQILHKFENNL